MVSCMDMGEWQTLTLCSRILALTAKPTFRLIRNIGIRKCGGKSLSLTLPVLGAFLVIAQSRTIITASGNCKLEGGTLVWKNYQLLYSFTHCGRRRLIISWVFWRPRQSWVMMGSSLPAMEDFLVRS